MSTANKILMGASGAGGDGPSDDEFNRVSFLSHFDGENNGVNNAFDDGSTSNHTITANGDVTQGSFGPFARPDGEWGVSFDGAAGDYLSIASSADFALGTGDFTVEFFVYHADLPSATTYFDYRSAQPQATLYLWLYGPTGAIQLHINGTTRAFTPPSMLGRWAHIAIARSSGTTKTFVDGTEYLSFSDSTDYVQGSTFTISKFFNGNENVNGAISNFRWIKGTAVYTSAFTPPTAPLTAITNTKLLTCQSNRFVDNSVSAHTITPYGNSAVTAFGPFLTSKVYDPAVNGASAYFDGSGDYLSAPTIISQSGNFTIEGWAYATGTSNQTICGQYGIGATGRMLIESTGGHILYFQDGVTTYIGSSNETRNQWCHFVLMRTGSNVAFYVNGTRVHNVSAANMYQGNFEVGGQPAISYDHKGYVSNIRCTASAVYSEGTSITVPTAPYSTVTNTNLLLNMADGQAIDSAAQNNLTLYGTAKTSTGQAKFGGASLLLDGNSDYVALPSNSFKPFGTGDFTIECFARFDAIDGKGLFQLGASYLPSAVTGPAVFASGGTNNRWRIYYGTSAVEASVSPSADTWHHVAYVRSSGVTKLYVDGTSVISQNDTTDYTNTFFVIGGAYSSSFLMDGYIDDFRISHMARYTSNFTAPSEPFPDKGQ